VNKKAYFKRKHYKEHEKQLFDYMFEVFLREDYEDIYHFREEEHRALSESRIKENRSLNSSQTRSVNNSFFVHLGKRFNSLQRYRDFSFSSLNSSVNGSFCRDSSCDEMSEYDRRVSAHRREVRQSSVCVSIKNIVDQDKVNRIVQGHLIPVRDSNVGEQKQTYLEDQGILEKDFGVKRDGCNLKYIKTNVSAWTNRT